MTNDTVRKTSELSTCQFNMFMALHRNVLCKKTRGMFHGHKELKENNSHQCQ